MTEYDPVLVDAPDVPPVSLAECKQHLRVDGDDEDTLIGIYLAAAIGHLDGADGWLGRSIVAQTWSQDFDGFMVANANGVRQLATSFFPLPGVAFNASFRLGLAPVTSIASVTYLDGAGVLQTVDAASYSLVNGRNAPEVRFVREFSIPVVRLDKPAVTVTFVAGYCDDEAAPGPLKAAILLMVGDIYQNRETKVATLLTENSTVRRLLDPYRRSWMA